MMHTNLRAPYLMIRSLAPLMIAARSGHIINISSLAGKCPARGRCLFRLQMGAQWADLFGCGGTAAI